MTRSPLPLLNSLQYSLLKNSLTFNLNAQVGLLCQFYTFLPKKQGEYIKENDENFYIKMVRSWENG